jgi:hypothetical protein
MEFNHPTVLFTDSEARGIEYATSAADSRIGIIVSSEDKIENIVFLTPTQAKAIANELGEMLTFIGRGNSWKRKRKKSNA